MSKSKTAGLVAGAALLLSNPNARHESRMVWLAVFAAGVALADWAQGVETTRRASRQDERFGVDQRRAVSA